MPEIQPVTEGAPKFPVALRFFQLFLLLLAVLFLVAPWFPTAWFVVRDGSGALVQFDRGHGNWMPLNLLWGTLGWVKIPWAFRALTAAAVALLCFRPGAAAAAAPGAAPGVITRRRLLGSVVLGLSCGLGFALFHVDPAINRTFGDGSSLALEIRAAGYVFPAEVLTMHLFNAVENLAVTVFGGRNDPIFTPLVTVCGSGAVFAWAIASVALLLGRDRVERFFLFAGPVLAGALTQFFGYIETTFLVLTAMALFFASAAWMLRADATAARRRRLMLVFGAVCLAMLAHGAGVVLLPATALLVCLVDRGKVGLRRLLVLKDPRIALGFVAIVLVPYFLLFVRPFVLNRSFAVDNLHGGADRFNFVPWHYESARAVSRYVYYSMLSWRHGLDIGMGFLVAAPLAVPMALVACVLRPPGKFQPGAPEREMFMVAVLAAAAAVSIPLLWQMDFGGWGDWNIVTAYLYPLQFLGWYAMLLARRNGPMPTRAVLVPALIVQIAMWTGLWLQLY